MNSWPWKNFPQHEMRCKETGELAMLPSFMDRLQRLRDDFAKPMVISSGYRSPKHSIEIAKSQPGTHAMGCAVDVQISGADVTRLIALANKHGFTGIGVRQHGEYKKRIVHLDDAPEAPWRPRPHFWSYP
jgi:zinc D-Ala-D-Ala carboxypeptidase